MGAAGGPLYGVVRAVVKVRLAVLAVLRVAVPAVTACMYQNDSLTAPSRSLHQCQIPCRIQHQHVCEDAVLLSLLLLLLPQDSNDDGSTIYVQSDGTTGTGDTTQMYDPIPVNITDGSWHHVLLTTVPPPPADSRTDGSSSTSAPKGYQLYLDGQLVGQLGDTSADQGVSPGSADTTATAPVDGGDFTTVSVGRIVLCGRSDADISRSFTGRLTQLLVFDRALTASDVQRVYLAAQPGFTPGGSMSSSSSSGVSFGYSPSSAAAAGGGAGAPSQEGSDSPDADTAFLPTPTISSSDGNSNSDSSSFGPNVVSAADASSPPPSTNTASRGSSSGGAAAAAAAGLGGCVGGFQWYLPTGSACDLDPQAVRCPRYCEPGLVRGVGKKGTRTMGEEGEWGGEGLKTRVGPCCSPCVKHWPSVVEGTGGGCGGRTTTIRIVLHNPNIPAQMYATNLWPTLERTSSSSTACTGPAFHGLPLTYVCIADGAGVLPGLCRGHLLWLSCQPCSQSSQPG
jgi:hypothetical protein